jgi:glycosyltransferase involved in cell wall biosynthesis
VRILLVNWNDRENPHAGGAEIHLHELFGRIAQWGHQVSLITSGWAGCAPHAVVDGMQVTRVGGRHSFALRGRGAVRRALREGWGGGTFDVVVEDINKVPLFLPTLTRLPLVAIVPHLFGTTAFAEASAPLAAVVWAAERPIPWVYRKSGFHAISESTRDDLVRRGVPAERVVVIHPGVDSVAYRPDPATPRAPRPTFLYLGRLKRYKGVEFALRAVAVARQARSDITLDICGLGDDRARLEALAATLGLGDAVRFLGFVSEEEKRRLLRQAWAVVFPSPKEGWGITNVEAAACGTPALASDSPGLRESVRHGVTGYLVPHGDARALADRILALAGDLALVERLGRAGRSFAEGLSWDAAARATVAHVQQSIAERTGRS